MKWDRILYKLPGGLLVVSGLLLLFAAALLVISSEDMSKRTMIVKDPIAQTTSEYTNE